MRISVKMRVTGLMAILVTVSLLAFGFATYLPLRAAVVRQEQAFLNYMNNAKLKGLQVAFAEVDSAVQTWAGSEFVRTNPTDKDGMMSRYLREQQAAHRNIFSRVFVVDSSGTVLGASDRTLVGRRIAEAWRGNELGDRFTLGTDSTPSMLPYSDRPTLAFAKTFEFANGAGAAVITYLNWNTLVEQYLSVGHVDSTDRPDAALLLLLNGRGTMIGSSNHSLNERQASSSRPIEHLQELGVTLDTLAPVVGQAFTFDFEARHYNSQRLDTTLNALGHDAGWTLITGRDQQLIDGDLNGLRFMLLTAGLGVVIFCCAVAYIVGGAISRNLLTLVPAFEKLAAGDLDCQVLSMSGDEVEVISRHFNAFVLKLRTVVMSIMDSTRTLSESSTLLADLSQNLVGNAMETSSQAGAASKISDEVSTNINTVSAGVEEMSLSINEIARSSDEAARVATSAVRIAEMTNTTVAELGGSSSEIGNVIKVINSIAEQTNLLALNATIEAARAGEAGKGFAVVANEVKELAKETARATEDIGKKIEAIQAKTKGAVNAIGEIGSIINQVNDYQTTIASAVQEQLATTTEIGRNIAEVAERSYMITKNITAVAQIAQNASSGANETRTATGAVSRISEELHGLVASFRYQR